MSFYLTMGADNVMNIINLEGEDFSPQSPLCEFAFVEGCISEGRNTHAGAGCVGYISGGRSTHSLLGQAAWVTLVEGGVHIVSWSRLRGLH